MTGVLGKKSAAAAMPPEELTSPSPSPMPLEIEETEQAKKQARGRKRGRASTILAGRLMSEKGKKLLGE